MLINIFWAIVLAKPPECVVLFAGVGDSCSGRAATVWVNAALGEAERFYDTVNGAFLQPQCTGKRNVERVPPFPVKGSDLVCIDQFDRPVEICHMKQCNLTSHKEFHNGDCDRSDDDDDDKKAACRSIDSWTAIGTDKLVQAMNALEQQLFNVSISYACAADFIFSHINRWIVETTPDPDESLPFLSEEGRRRFKYDNIISALREATFIGPAINVELRAVQELRQCRPAHRWQQRKRSAFAALAILPGESLDANSTLLQDQVAAALIFSNFIGTNQSVVGSAQFDWAPTGSIPSFGATFGPADNVFVCVKEDADTNLAQFDATRVFPPLTVRDTAVTRDDGPPRSYAGLSTGSACSIIVLLRNLRSGDNASSVTQLQLAQPPQATQPSNFSAEIEAGIILRNANDEGCTDSTALFTDVFTNTSAPPASNTSTLGFSVKFIQPPAGVPLTLAPGESRCVGGDRAGSLCTQASECGAHRACRRKPFAPREVAFCYDGSQWDESRPCAFADEDEECPFGECVGEVNDVAGGAYPLLHFYQANACGQAAGANSPVCADARVAAWYQYPNTRVFGQ